MKSIFESIIGKENVFINEPMSLHTTFKIGGTADYFLTPESYDQTASLIKYLSENNVKYLVLGNGSNVLVGDKGIRDVVICLYKKMEAVVCEGNEIFAQCGALLSKVASVARENSLKDFEFASGIPGCIGGAVYMNAGAYGSEMKDVIKSVKYIDECGEIKDIDGVDCEFGYRHSFFTGKNLAIIGCTIALKHGDKEEILKITKELTEKRVSKQPLDKPSAGSVFKRPEGNFAGTLIEQSGLKGFSIGGAQVSQKHAGFIINKGGATAKDVLDLIEYIKKVVNEKFGVMLEPEVKTIGEF